MAMPCSCHGHACWCRDRAGAVAAGAGIVPVPWPCHVSAMAMHVGAMATRVGAMATRVGAMTVPRQCRGSSCWCNAGAGAVPTCCPRVPAHPPRAPIAGRVLISHRDPPLPGRGPPTRPHGALGQLVPGWGAPPGPPPAAPRTPPHPLHSPPRPPGRPHVSVSRRHRTSSIQRRSRGSTPVPPTPPPPPRATPAPRPPRPRAPLPPPPPKHIPHGSRSCPCPRASSPAGTRPGTGLGTAWHGPAWLGAPHRGPPLCRVVAGGGRGRRR
ncbi:cleavage and polyadenylation specificity factor subunit 6-like [Corapipo altera]|uniref:cleavage and polyadenylation specificity factor subunit 6-like n=1 Tax=Corapipo altera TaxID=415028 RepID=UPI000FD63AA8|nr:cleavage and polyadenylation specificity factor subunit 6-like [Corapipo altera]